MADNGMHRQLKAIFSTDVKGYSKLMGEDDTFTAFRNIIATLIGKHRGRVVDTPGDNVLAEFDSALDAVTGAIAIQYSLKTENQKLPEGRRMDFRIGINLGDIIRKDDRIYGDGVNVAARIESLADPGGICISRGVFDQVIYAPQDAITHAVVSSLGETIWRVRAKDLNRKPIANFNAFDYVLKGDELVDRLENPQENKQARGFYAKAIELDPALMRAHLGMGWTYFLDWMSGWTPEGAEVLQKAEIAADKTAALEEKDAEIQRLLGRVAMAKGHHEEGLAHMERALELNPSNGDLIATYRLFL